MLDSAHITAAAVRLAFAERLTGSILTCGGATLWMAVLIAAVIRLHARSLGAGLLPGRLCGRSFGRLVGSS